MTTVTIIVVDGIVTASVLFLLAAGLSVIYGVLRILNFAHGSIYALGAFAGAILVTEFLEREISHDFEYGTFLALFAGALIVGLAAGPVLERGVLRFLYGRDPALQLLATYALFLMLEGLQQAVWGGKTYSPFVPYSQLGQFDASGISYPNYDILLLAVAVGAALFLWLLLERSRFGRLVSAATHDPEMSRAMGINLGRVYVVTFTIGAFLVALGGAFAAPTISVVPGFAVDTTVAAFAVVVIGGLGSVAGAAVGALIVGIGEAAAVQLAPNMEIFVIYLAMTLVLLVRPQGLFAKAAVRRI